MATWSGRCMIPFQTFSGTRSVGVGRGHLRPRRLRLAAKPGLCGSLRNEHASSWILFRNNSYVCHHLIILLAKIVFHPARVRNSPLGVIDHTEERAARGVLLVFRDIYYQLLAELSRRESWPRHLVILISTTASTSGRRKSIRDAPPA